MLERIKNEPSLVSGLIVALLTLGAAFGLNLTGEQTAAITAAGGAILAFIVRGQVTPTRKTDETGAGELKLVALVVVAVILAWVLVIPFLERTF
jgi:hypothetical protein